MVSSTQLHSSFSNLRYVSGSIAIALFPVDLPGIRERVSIAHNEAHHKGNCHCRDEGRIKYHGNDHCEGDGAPEQCDTHAANDADQADLKRNEREEPESKDPEGPPDKESRKDVSSCKAGGKMRR